MEICGIGSSKNQMNLQPPVDLFVPYLIRTVREWSNPLAASAEPVANWNWEKLEKE